MGVIGLVCMLKCTSSQAIFSWMIDGADNGGMRVGELAELVGCAPSAVRYYERAGLLEPPARVSGQRRYPRQAVDRMELILLLRDVGLTINDLRIALDRSAANADARRANAVTRAADLREQLRTIGKALAVLDHSGECTSIDDTDAACAADIRRRLADAGLLDDSESRWVRVNEWIA